MKKALIVGLNKYPAGSELEWCDNDAIAIRELIESNGDGSPNFEAIQITDTRWAAFLFIQLFEQKENSIL